MSYQEAESFINEELEDQGILKTGPNDSVTSKESHFGSVGEFEVEVSLAESSAEDPLQEILRKIARHDQSEAGLQELYKVILDNPKVDLEPYLEKSSQYFRDYVERGLQKIQQADQPARRKSVAKEKILAKQVRTDTDIPCLTDDDDSDDEEDGHPEPLAAKPLKKNLSSLQAPSMEKWTKALDNGTEKKMKKKKSKKVTNKSKKKGIVNPSKFQDEDIPYNPHNLQFEDEEGNALTPGSSAFLSQFGKAHKLTKRTQARYTAEHNRFEKFVSKTFGAQVLADYLASALPPPKVADLVSDYLLNRINLRVWRTEGRKQFLDTTTARLVWAKISRVMRQKTNFNMSTMPAFQTSKDSLATIRDLAKEVPGLGENQGQAQGLSRVQLSYLLHHDHLSLHTPVGLVSLFYISFVVTFLPRVREETMRVTRGDFRRIFNPNGTVRCIVYCPRGKCKRDRGGRGGEQGAAVFKRPIALPSKEPKISFPVILDTYEAHLDILPWEGDRADQPMFMQYHKETPKPGESFFMPSRLGINSFDNILRKVIRSTGLKTNPHQQCNQALRPTAFGIHKLLGLDTSFFMAMAGHVSARTHTIYIRGQVELLEGVTGNFLEATTGVEAVRPANDTVEIFDSVTHRTEVRRVKDFLPLLTPEGKQTGIFPLSGIEYEDLFRVLPEVRDDSDLLEEQPDLVDHQTTSSVPGSTTPAKPGSAFKRPSDKEFRTTSPSSSKQSITSRTSEDTTGTLLDLSPARPSNSAALDLSGTGPLNLVTTPSRSRQTSLQSTSDPGPTNTVSRRSDFSFKRPRVALTNQLPLTTYAPQNFSTISLMENLSPSKQKVLNLTSPTTQQPLQSGDHC